MKALPRFFISLFMFLSFFAQPLTLLACGVSFTGSRGSWAYGNDSAEQSFINYQDGTEKLMITRDFKNGDQKTVWIIPIPADPKSITVDSVSEVPQFVGENVITAAEEVFSGVLKFITYTQLYTLLVNGLAYIDGYSNFEGALGALPGGTRSTLEVHSRLEEKGIVAEVLSAENSDDIYEYFAEQGLDIEKNTIPILQEYIGKDFAFIASWVDDKADQSLPKGLLMSFPTSEIFYPLKPGSVYEGNGLPEYITVVGYVKPNLYEDIQSSARITYNFSKNPIDIPGFFTADKNYRFTQVNIYTSPKKLTEDLTFSHKTPLRPVVSEYLILYPFITQAVFYVLLTVLATLVTTRLVVPGQIRRNFWKLTLANCLSLIGTIIGSRLFLKEKRVTYVVVFSITYLFMSYLIFYILDIIHYNLPM